MGKKKEELLSEKSMSFRDNTLNLSMHSSESEAADEIFLSGRLDMRGSMKFMEYAVAPPSQHPHSHKGKQIKLEILGKRGIYILLLLNYFIIFCSVTMDIVESKFRIAQFNEQSNGTLLHKNFQYETTYDGFNGFNRFLLWALVISTDIEYNISATSEATPLQYFKPSHGFPVNVISDTVGHMLTANQSVTITIQSIVSGRNKKEEEWKDLSDSLFNATCSFQEEKCSELPALYYSPVIEYGEYRLNLTVSHVSGSHSLKKLKWELSLLTHDQNYTKAECVIFTFLLLTTLTYLVYYVVQWTWYHSWKDALPEQKWMFFVLIALFLYQNPVFLPQLLNSNIISDAAGQIIENIAYCFFLALWILIVHGISLTERHSYSIWFYAPKAIFGLLYFAVMTYITLVPYWNVKVSEGVITRVKSQVNVAWMASLLLLVVFSVFWFFWLAVRTYKTYRTLRGLPFLATRYRQLTFRFIFFLSFLAVCYLTLSLFIKRGRNGT